MPGQFPQRRAKSKQAQIHCTASWNVSGGLVRKALRARILPSYRPGCSSRRSPSSASTYRFTHISKLSSVLTTLRENASLGVPLKRAAASSASLRRPGNPFSSTKSKSMVRWLTLGRTYCPFTAAGTTCLMAAPKVAASEILSPGHILMGAVSEMRLTARSYLSRGVIEPMPGSPPSSTDSFLSVSRPYS